MNNTDYCQNLYDVCEKLIIAYDLEKDSPVYELKDRMIDLYIIELKQAMKGKPS